MLDPALPQRICVIVSEGYDGMVEIQPRRLGRQVELVIDVIKYTVSCSWALLIYHTDGVI